MSTERKFTQKVAIIISGDQQEQIKTQLQSLGYEVSSVYSDFGKYPYVTNNYGGMTGYAGNNTSHQNRDLLVDDPELFLALGACSEGETFYPGEWVVVNDRSVDELLVVHEMEYEKSYISVKRISEAKEPGYFTLPKSHFRKATVEEITAHFSQKEEIAPGDWVVCDFKGSTIHYGDIYQVTECTSETLTIDTGLKSNWFYIINANGKKNFRKATPEEIAAHLAKKGEVKPEWSPSFGEEVQGRFKNGKYCLGSYIEPSQMFSLHYVEDKHSKEIYQCASVEPIPKVTVELGLLLEMYAERHNIDPSQIIVK